ncbi:MAG TPA: HEXXH motif-containing putative peptide modification protein [Oligoflexus sp.]|uniref:aKG-HExxH-type peptide beta-hydroxylase n=1 Tax=Oligoflexus sp. TaxID=1971216 RepID=UPI002D3B9CBF|nr:HEXXH motif-containing putative peptide modification protein [Oligoflexus sp.]HYX33266.1 HEXXH motif-containing putative peptide modification protein [Oligoflexus sp.]
MYYSATLARKNRQWMPQFAVPLRHFVLADGEAIDHDKTLDWYAELVSLHVTILKEIMAKELDNDPDIAELMALLDLMDNLPGEWNRQYLCQPIFCMWLNLVLKSFEDHSSLKNCTDQLYTLPLLLISLLQSIQADFQMRIWIGKAVDPIGLSWGLSAVNPGFHTLIVSPSAQEMSIWRDEECLATWSYDSLQPLQKSASVCMHRPGLLGVYDRYYALDSIEITDYERYAHFGWKDYKHLDYDQSTAEILQYMDASFTCLESAWPEALRGMQTYGRLLAVGSPMNLDSNNSASMNIFPFAQALEVPLKHPLKNLESMIHEMSHCKLHILLAGEKLYHNADDDLSFRHPWLPMARPLRGVMLGSHAFLNVLELYTRTSRTLPEMEAFSCEQFALRQAEVQHVLFEEAVKGDFTPKGLEFLTLMQDRFRTLAAEMRS